MTTDQKTDNGYELITELDDLHFYLKQALRLEHATIPPYITALYSLKPGTNLEAFHIIRAVAVEEMLHLTLVANLLNAVGGDIKFTLTHPDFVPEYPAYLPTGATDFQVHLRKFCPEAVQNFMQIERAEEVEEGKPLVVSRSVQERDHFLTIHKGEKSNTFHSIGLFYSEIIRGLFALNKKMEKEGSKLFSGDPERQITPAYYYNGGGDIIPVTDLRSAMRAMRVIQEQGEGSRVRTIYDAERELAHYYRFQQLVLSEENIKLDKGQYYVIDKDNPDKSNTPGNPTGAFFKVDWDEVYPLKEDACLSHYDPGTEVYKAAQDFESAYRQFLADLEHAFDGYPEALIPAVGGMFRLKEQANSLIRNPIPGDKDGCHAAPIFPVAPPKSPKYPDPPSIALKD
jgi:hypothetical protein